MNSRPLSVIIPVFNGAEFLDNAIASVRRAGLAHEMVIVDDGSTDETPQIVRQLDRGDIQYIRQPNRGPAAARNRGLETAHGEVIAFLDADDCWAENHPRFALDYLDQHQVDLVLGRTQCVMPARMDPSSYQPFGESFHSFQLGAVVCRRELLNRIGLFDETFRYAEDVDWFLRARECGARIAALPEISVYYHLRRGNESDVYRKMRDGFLNALHRSLERRRHSSVNIPASPLVSAIIPVYNGERFVADAVESVLAQDYRPLEIIVVDDGSTDGTLAVLKKFPQISVHYQSRKGTGAARNTGVRQARGDLLGFLDADDLWTQGKVSRQVAVLRQDSETEAVFGHVSEFRGDETNASVRETPGPVPGTMLIRRAAFERIGWFNESNNALEAADWYLRALEKSLRFEMLPDLFYRRRIHGGNRSLTTCDLQGYVRAIKESLDRRRAKADEHAGR